MSKTLIIFVLLINSLIIYCIVSDLKIIIHEYKMKNIKKQNLLKWRINIDLSEDEVEILEELVKFNSCSSTSEYIRKALKKEINKKGA